MSDTIESEVIGLSCIEKRYADQLRPKRFSNETAHIPYRNCIYWALAPTSSVVPAALANPNL